MVAVGTTNAVGGSEGYFSLTHTSMGMLYFEPRKWTGIVPLNFSSCIVLRVLHGIWWEEKREREWEKERERKVGEIQGKGDRIGG